MEDEFETMLAQFEELELTGAQVSASEVVEVQSIENNQSQDIIEPILNNDIIELKEAIEEIIVEEPVVELSFFGKITKLLEEIYPDRWDIVDEFRAIDAFALGHSKTVLIKFDTLNLTNTLDHKHTVDNLYVALNFRKAGDDKYTFYGKMYGCRETVTYAEYCSNYRHSHIRTGKAGFGDFCVGSGSDMSDLLNGLAVEWNIVRFEVLLYQLMDYLAWESLEGVPFITISRIVERSNDDSNYANLIDKQSALQKFVNIQLKQLKYTLPIKLEKTVRGVDYISINQLDEIYLTTLATCTSKLVCRQPNGEYGYKQSSVNNRDITKINEGLKTDRVFKFKGKDVIYQIKLKTDSIEDNNNVVLYPEPGIVNYVTDKLTLWINDYYNNIEHL